MHLSGLKKILFVITLLSSICSLAQVSAPLTTPKQLDIMNNEIWRRFIDPWGIMYEYTDLDGTVIYPTAEELLAGKPNALGWNTPLENGAMYGGMYIDGIIKRWEHTQKTEDALKVKKIAQGLMYLSTVSPVPGMIARGVGKDGTGYYLMGSDDQAGGWYYGMWRYLQTSIPDAAERKTIENKIVEVSKAIVALNWFLPSDPPFNRRGTFISFDYQAPRLLLVCKICYEITKDEYWNKLYQRMLYEKGGNPKLSRLEVATKGFASNAVVGSWWVRAVTIGCQRLLWEIETDSIIKSGYGQGLELTANSAFNFVGMGFKLKRNDTSVFDINWRKLNELWKPQLTENESQDLAVKQFTLIVDTRRGREDHAVRQACFAAWVVSLAPNKMTFKRRIPDLKMLIEQFDYTNIYHSWFFPLEATGWRVYDSY